MSWYLLADLLLFSSPPQLQILDGLPVSLTHPLSYRYLPWRTCYAHMPHSPVRTRPPQAVHPPLRCLSRPSSLLQNYMQELPTERCPHSWVPCRIPWLTKPYLNPGISCGLRRCASRRVTCPLGIGAGGPITSMVWCTQVALGGKTMFRRHSCG